MELFQAHNQWKFRPEDQRFPSLLALHNACKGYAASATERPAQFSDLRAEKVDDDLVLMGRGSVPARLTNWAFGQLCQRIEAPASYLRELPATLAAQNVNYGLKNRVNNSTGSDTASLLFHENGSLLCRAITTEKYSRIWNWEITERLLGLEPLGWTPAMPDIRTSDKDFPSLYASDHDMFAFLRNPNLTIDEAGSDGAVYKGIIVSNSEVGAAALKFTRFLYREMCGNHIIWGASKVMDVSIRHIGDAKYRWQFAADVKKYADESVSDLEAQIKFSKTFMLGTDKQKVLDTVFGKRIPALTQAVIEAGYNAVKEEQDGSARSLWGFVQGLTRHSQTLPHADKRTEIDKAAGKLAAAF